MKNFLTYLVYIAVLARVAGWSQDSTPIPPEVWILLCVFGVVMFTEPFLTHRYPWYPRFYTLIQSILVICMLYIDPTLDILTMLFLPLSFQAVRFFGDRLGFAWIGAFSLAMVGLFFFELDWRDGIIMVSLSTIANVLMGRYAQLITRTDQRHLENQNLYAQLQAAYSQLMNSAVQAEKLAAAEERHRLARELHDSLTQTLFSMNLAAETAKLTIGSDPELAKNHLQRLQNLAQIALNEVKELYNPSPGVELTKNGLADSLKRLAEERSTQDGLYVIVEVSGNRVLPSLVQENLYRISQEALNNVIRHSGARQANIRLIQDSPIARMEVSDTGCGFDTKGQEVAGGYGLLGMAERVNEIGWLLNITSQPGQGTRISVEEKPG